MTDYDNYETLVPELSIEEVAQWFMQKLGRPADANDVYKLVAKDFYQLGAYSRCITCLNYYITLSGSQMMGRHLLGYCHLNLEGFHDDWQLVVELTIEQLEHKAMTS
ncbi:hypothetical protein ROZALSC1DRAFT_31119 [Rozella allomycis CSF55]|uniref:Uncharacterized protein n=1 Tax=Rozella allomycis (strain CSF55) TaxID=988480 RepID=A0A075AWS3_ROZAC|nr:hypothetical protein O9G_001111 [Rozella allomycis CSF55]RKP17035.1 hypothetical protein ROZALSC1DRAFT_31119 [Rozella allomycis CSF55]|eukprot:EPZ33142.1 hypothetical protein O9G_001111 [Rozella allomycis CSF55]